MSKRGWEGWYTPTSHSWPESQGWIKGGYIRVCVFVGLCVRVCGIVCACARACIKRVCEFPLNCGKQAR